MKTSRLQQSPPLLIPGTEGIKYAGSKLKLLPHILPLICGLRGVHTVIDGFSGSTRVSQALYQMGRFNVVSNDVSAWSEVFARCYLQADQPAEYYQLFIDRLNALTPHEGWFTEHYGGAVEGLKYPFQRKNTMRLDAIRTQIAEWRTSGEIDRTTECVLLTSLMLALDRVDSTLGHFSSYLKQWSKRSFNDLELTLPRLCYNPTYPVSTVTRGDIFDLLSVPDFAEKIRNGSEGEDVLAYYDPPYGSNNAKMPPSRVRYASYYHFWTSVVLNDHPPVFGKASRREDSRDQVAASVFEDYHTAPDGHHVAMEAIDRLIACTPARYILLSYSSSGRATRDELLEVLHANGNLRQTLSLDHAHHVMSRMQWTKRWLNADEEHKEYLFLLEK